MALNEMRYAGALLDAVEVGSREKVFHGNRLLIQHSALSSSSRLVSIIIIGISPLPYASRSASADATILSTFSLTFWQSKRFCFLVEFVVVFAHSANPVLLACLSEAELVLLEPLVRPLLKCVPLLYGRWSG